MAAQTYTVALRGETRRVISRSPWKTWFNQHPYKTPLCVKATLSGTAVGVATRLLVGYVCTSRVEALDVEGQVAMVACQRRITHTPFIFCAVSEPDEQQMMDARCLSL